MASSWAECKAQLVFPTVHCIISGISRMKRGTNRRPTVPHGGQKNLNKYLNKKQNWL